MAMKNIKWRYIAFILPALVFSCAKKQPATTWLKIGKWVLQSNPDAQFPEGELTQDIDQVFVSMDGKSLGTYQVPVKIPIVANSGKHDFVFVAGITENGINATKNRYPLVKNYSTSIQLVQNDTASVTPKTSYYANMKFLIEDFESPSLHLEVGNGSTATITRENDPSILKWGNYYGSVELNQQDTLLSVATTFGESFPKQATPVYMELDYINTNSVLTSLISFGNGTYYTDPYIQINPQIPADAKWKHMYINLTEDVSYRVTSPQNEVQFTFLFDKGKLSSYFYIDNIKIIYPQ